ncbi:MAG: iron-sulfur cluster assembly protein [Flavobacteriales bacterium]
MHKLRVLIRLIQNKAMVTVSDTAKERLLLTMREEGFAADDYVRVGVNTGGCSGLSYDLKFDNEQKEEDKLFEDKGVKILVDKKSFFYLIGTTLEYSGGLNGKGFFFNNPNASRTCGCGESFAV